MSLWGLAATGDDVPDRDGWVIRSASGRASVASEDPAVRTVIELRSGGCAVRVNWRVLGWGVFFVVVGLVPIAVRGGAIDELTVRLAWGLWPLILIGIGLGLLLERTAAAVIGNIVVAVTFGLMVGSVLAVGFGPVAGIGSCGFGAGIARGDPFPEQTGTLGGAADVSLDLSCGEVTATTGSGSDWQVSGRSENGTPPQISAAPARLSIRSPNHQAFGLGAAASWQVTLPQDPSLTLDATVNAGTARLDLSDAHVSGIDLSVNAGEAHLSLGGAAGSMSVNASVNAGALTLSLPAPNGVLTGDLSANAGSINMCIPDGVALQIRSSNSLGVNNFGSQGLTREGDVWSNQVPGLSSSRIELTTSTNLGSITLNPEAGCE